MRDSDCAAVRAALAAGEPIDARHVAGCPSCSALLDGELAGSIAEPPPAREDPIVQAVLAKVQADRAPLVRASSRARAGALGGGLLLLWALAWGLGAGPRSVVDPVGGALAVALAAAVALRPVHREPLPGQAGWVAAALAVPLALGASPPWGWATPVSGWGCFWRGLAVVGLVAAAWGGSERRTRIPASAWLAAAAAGGGAAAVALALWCPFEGSWHRLLAHGSPGAVGALAIALGARAARILPARR